MATDLTSVNITVNAYPELKAPGQAKKPKVKRGR
jgi:hypothetical protein